MAWDGTGQPPMEPEREVERYLRFLFEDAVEEHGLYFVIFPLPHHKAEAFGGDDAFGRASSFCVEASAKSEVYVGMGLFRTPPATGQGRRGTEKDVDAIAALWADIDVADPKAHKGKAYPKSYDEARSIARVSDIAPSVEVESGYGLHCYWLLQEPWIFETPDDHKQARHAMMRWLGTIKSQAKARDLHVDSVFDLARVLRVAGTVNHKGAEPKPVRLIAGDAPTRYLVDSLEPYMIALEYVQEGPALRAEVAHFVLHPDASVDPAQFAAAMENIPGFKETWEQQRTDLSDPSPSGYDLALANILVAMGYDDQRIVDTLIYWRRKHGHKAKLRVDYYQRTIGKARATDQSSRALENLVSGNSDVPASTTPEDLTDKNRQMVLNWLRNLLRIKISGFQKFGEDDAIYFIVLEDGTRFSIGTASQVLQSRRVRERLFEKCGVVIDPLRDEQWGRIIERMNAIIEVNTHAEARTQDVMRRRLARYFEGARVLKDEEWQDALRDSSPFVRDGAFYVATDHFVQWMRLHGERLDVKDVRRDFRLLGLESKQVCGRIRSDRVNRHYWTASMATLKESTYGDEDNVGEPVEAEEVVASN